MVALKWQPVTHWISRALEELPSGVVRTGFSPVAGTAEEHVVG